MKPRKAPAAETGINPKLAALAAELDEAHAHARAVEAAADNRVSSAAYSKIWKLGKKLARMAATNLEELKLKDPLCRSRSRFKRPHNGRIDRPRPSRA